MILKTIITSLLIISITYSQTLIINESMSKNTIAVFDIMGRHVKTLVEKNQVAGFKTVKWDATNSPGRRVAAGMYIYQIKAGAFNDTKKMILLK